MTTEGRGPLPTGWGVVATVDEPAPLVAAMAAHHLDQGAAQVFLYLDRPDPDLRVLIGHLPGVVITDCDGAYWARVRHAGRHRDHVWRQVINANHAYARARVGWLLHCDADEFVADGAALARELAALPDEVHSLILPNVERAFCRGRPQADLFEGVFRRPWRGWRRFGWLMQGRHSGIFQDGLSAHALGKSVTRTACGRWLEIHRCAALTDTPVPTRFARASEARIVHFDGLTPAHWQAKMARLHAELPLRSYGRMSPTRRHVMAEMRRAGGDPAALARVFGRVQTLGFWQRLAMRLLGMMWRGRIDPGAAVARLCPAAAVTPEAFDAALVARDRPAMLAAE